MKGRWIAGASSGAPTPGGVSGSVDVELGRERAGRGGDAGPAGPPQGKRERKIERESERERERARARERERELESGVPSGEARDWREAGHRCSIADHRFRSVSRWGMGRERRGRG